MMDADEDSHSSVYMTGSRRLLNCLESEDFEGAYRELNQIYQSAFSRNQKELRINRYRMYGLIGTLITTLDISANEEDKAYYQSLNYEDVCFVSSRSMSCCQKAGQFLRRSFSTDRINLQNENRSGWKKCRNIFRGIIRTAI